MLETRTTTDLPAPLERVWAVLTDFVGYEKWHPLLRIGGEARLDSQIRYSRRLSLKSSRWVTVDADIVEFVELSEMVWRQGVRRVFLTDVSLQVEAIEGGTRLTHVMRNSGLLAALVAPILRRKNKASMDLFDGLLARRLAPAPRQTRRSTGARTSRRGRRAGR